MSFERNIARLVQAHMEALHDDLRDVLSELDGADRTLGDVLDGRGFATIVGSYVRDGLMTTGEYEDWFNEEVSAR
jgi:hypothetical protein